MTLKTKLSKVYRKIPEPPEFVRVKSRNPHIAAIVFSAFMLIFSAAFVLTLSLGNIQSLSLIPPTILNAYIWTWLGWRTFIPSTGVVPQRKTALVGAFTGIFFFITIGPLTSGTLFMVNKMNSNVVTAIDWFSAVIGLGIFYSVASFIFTLGIPLFASIFFSVWIIDHEKYIRL